MLKILFRNVQMCSEFSASNKLELQILFHAVILLYTFIWTVKKNSAISISDIMSTNCIDRVYDKDYEFHLNAERMENFSDIF